MDETKVDESKALLLEVLGEIDQADGEMFKPPNKMCKHDKEIGIISDKYLKKLFALTAYYGREAAKLKASMSFEPDNEELKIEFHQMDAKEDLLREMFWFAVRTKYNLWKYDSVGVRQGWAVVQDNHSDDKGDLPPFIKKLLDE